MRSIINIVLLLVVVLLAYLLISSIRGPIEFKTEFEKRENAVIAKLEEHRTFQVSFKNLTGEFAKTYDTLKQVIMSDSFEIVKVIGDADAVGGGEIKKSYTYVSAKDSLANVFGVESSELPAMIDKLADIPYSDNGKFEMKADTITFQKINVPVISVGTTYESFMKEFNNDKFKRYDSSFDPEAPIGYGNLNKPSTSGSWD